MHRRPAGKPSPSGRGWGEGETPATANLDVISNRATRLTVIPAQAGIQNPGVSRRSDRPGVWIPAFAGMTVGATA